MNVTCPAITVTELPGASCSFANSAMPGGKTKFNVTNITGWTASGSDANMILANDVGDEIEITVNRYYNGGWDIAAPSELGDYTYSLKYLGESICDVALSVAYPKITSTSCGFNYHSWESKYFFTTGSSFSNWDNTISDNLSMDLYLDDEKITTLSVSKNWNGDMIQIVFPTEPGTYTYKVMFHDNEVCSVVKEIE